MRIEAAERVRMEQAHVSAWPALHTAVVGGWLWRCSGGGSQRANSVSTVAFEPDETVAARIAEVEARYRARGVAARFQTFDETRPAGLPDVLRRRGYRPTTSTTTMFRRLDAAPRPPPDAVEMRGEPWPEWLDVYLGTITPDRREANRRILQRIPARRGFFGCRRDGRIVAVALCVIGHGCAVVECVATMAAERRRGSAQSVLQALLAWSVGSGVDLAGLQVAPDNPAAIRLYESQGFVAGATNRFWVRDDPY